jgi:hypothetical protein
MIARGIKKKRNKFKFGDTFKNQDWFGVPVTLNANGEESIKSTPGACISLILTVFLFIYAI